MKRIAIASEGKDINANLAYRAGMCRWFCILHPDGKISFLENPGYLADAAFGFHAFKFLESQNVNTIVARFFGPRFQELSRETGINLIVPPPHIYKVRGIIESFNS
ncbi:MAG: NifB/NifX family molybdenum-iron cluster-binding protein [Bacteroidales bacterium]|jgi:predicted Fe-Mo cluster-binding NifX family protein